MPISFQKAQNSLAKSNFLDQLSRTEPGAEALTETTAAILRVVGEFVADCETNLRKADRVSTGSLTDSIRPEVVEAGVNNIVDVYINSYYKFVDKGVRGWRDKKGSGSPYAFKAPGQAKTGQSKMVTAIRKWVIKEGIKFRNTKVAVTPRENRRAKITDASTKAAIVISGRIRRDGLKRTNFFTDAVRTLEDKLGRNVADALRIDVIESFN